MQARAKAAEEALAAAKAVTEQERLELQGQADESRTVVGQWKDAYEKLTSQYEEMQVSVGTYWSASYDVFPAQCMQNFWHPRWLAVCEVYHWPMPSRQTSWGLIIHTQVSRMYMGGAQLWHAMTPLQLVFPCRLHTRCCSSTPALRSRSWQRRGAGRLLQPSAAGPSPRMAARPRGCGRCMASLRSRTRSLPVPGQRTR